MSPNPQSLSRRGSAFILAIAVMVILLSLSMALTETTIGSLGESNRRKDQVAMNVSTESVGNLALSYLGGEANLDSLLNTAKANPTTRYDITSAVTALAGTDSTSHLNGAAGSAGRLTNNGFDTWVSWGLQGTVTVPFFGKNQATNVYRIVATVADSGPAKLYNTDGTQKAIANPTLYRRQRIEALFVAFPSTYFQQAMYARKGYEYMGSATTDSWNSNNGAVGYSTSTKGAHGDLSSEGNIIVQKPLNVQGQVTPNVKIPVPTFSYNPPSNATNLPTSSGKTIEAGPLATGNYRTPAIDLSTNNKTISFAANSVVTIYVDGPITIKQNWVIPANCTVTIWQNNYDCTLGTTTLNGNINVGCIQNPSAFRWLSLFDGTIPDATTPGGIDVKMNGSATLGGLLVFPYATFQLNGGFDYYGSLLADSFKDTTGMGKVNGNFAFHYDESLSTVALPLPPALIIVGWRAFPLSLSKAQEDLQ